MEAKRFRTIAIATGLVAALALPASASAVTRYAAPGGTALAADCVTPIAPPCSISEAAEGTGVSNGDEVMIASGAYSDTAGDLGADVVNPVAQIHLHGDPNEPRPVITMNTNFSFGAFFISDGQKLSHIRLETDVADYGFTAIGGIVEGVIADSGTDSGQIVCNHSPGLNPTIIRDTVCLSSGDSTVALGANVGTFAGTHPAVLRNVTAISTGTGSSGVSYRVFGSGVDWNVDAKSVIADGNGTDVFAGGFNAADTSIVLDASNYASTNTGTSMGGVASVTAAGTGTNQTVPPMLAADGFHQLPGSPTVGAGATDASSGTVDIDGQARQIPAGDPDIGADELGNATSTSVVCNPGALTLGSGASTCAATVADTAGSPVTPAGSVSFASSSAGGFSAPSCVLAGGGSSAACQVTYTPSALGSGSHGITATFPLGGSHEGSQGSAALAVTKPQQPGAGKKKCKKAKKKRAAAAKKKRRSARRRRRKK